MSCYIRISLSPSLYLTISLALPSALDSFLCHASSDDNSGHSDRLTAAASNECAVSSWYPALTDLHSANLQCALCPHLSVAFLSVSLQYPSLPHSNCSILTGWHLWSRTTQRCSPNEDRAASNYHAKSAYRLSIIGVFDIFSKSVSFISLYLAKCFHGNIFSGLKGLNLGLKSN